MTTKRKRSQATSRDGVNFVQGLVERQNSTFQEIDLHNDLGNDAYVEFVVEENATGCCVALQIKSGASYRSLSGRYVFQSDSDHFEYWASHTLPVLAVIFDPERKKAVWVDITDHLRKKPSAITDGPYTIYADQDFSESTFPEFRNHCLRYRDQYSREPNFGRALESVSIRDDVERCFDGLRALFAYHRNQSATWYYLISCITNYRGHALLRTLIARLCHIPGHGDIFWSKRNIIDEEVRRGALLIMRERFDRRDALTMLSAIDDAGVDRGTIGQCVHVLIDTMEDTQGVMESIAIDTSQDERIRHSALLFAVSAAQALSAASALALLDRVRHSIDDEELNSVVEWLEGDLRQFGYVSFY
ncbi:DUF4365 domain-containing protein [Pseudomonas sp. UBA2684]|uniref:DUF4365 domain-containing protein n=1 Tax=Pseudomonas sp. UBA2684 TaxID=1947311 RepID=UPI0025E63E38|nr:DUF4365 domain-containing protein [Pseudomonas sp. UBA2684]|tara:strand:- start:9119 stop:10198 length:1080 start_codon:yes stop_codon:yes gene_type:complete